MFSAETPLPQASRLVEQKRFSEAETIYRGVLASAPSSREAALGLGRVLLWQSRFSEAAGVFRKLTTRNPSDAEALEGLATALYWDGDYRGAEREFERLAAIRPGNEMAGRSLEEIRSTARPIWRAAGEVIDDDQPYTLSRAEAGGSFFTDPLTRWDGHAGSYFYDDPRRGRDGDVPYIGLGGEIVLPRFRLTVAPAVTAIRFPDEETKFLTALILSLRPSGGGMLFQVVGRQRELLRTSAATATHAYVAELGARVEVDRSGWMGAGSAHHLRYFDGNEGMSADAWILMPLLRSGTFSLHGGLSAAARDTDDSRFTEDGVYAPYYTPMGQREGRAIAAANWKWGAGGSLSLHADAGRGQDDIAGDFEPWRAAVNLGVPLTPAIHVDLRYERSATAFYESDHVSASVVGRF